MLIIFPKYLVKVSRIWLLSKFIRLTFWTEGVYEWISNCSGHQTMYLNFTENSNVMYIFFGNTIYLGAILVALNMQLCSSGGQHNHVLLLVKRISCLLECNFLNFLIMCQVCCVCSSKTLHTWNSARTRKFDSGVRYYIGLALVI
jgi:hypothetical protein